MSKPYIAERFQTHTDGLSLDTGALARYKDIIDLSIGDTDIVTDRRIIDAAYRDACAGYTRYGDPKGDPELIEGVCRAYKEDFDLTVGPENVFVSASSCLGMAICMMAILNPGDEVLLFSPYFSIYRTQVALAGGVAVEVPTYEEDGYAIREDLLRRAITPRTKAMIVNNPANPTGTAYSAETMAMIARVACEYDLLVAADEIYTQYMFEEPFVPLCSLPGMAARTMTLNSFSKNFLMTGWRVGYIIAAPELIATFQQINNNLIYAAPAPSQRAAIEALKLRKSVQALYISEYRKRVYYAADRIERIPYLTLCRPKGTFYLFPGVERTGLSAEEFCQRLLEEAHILVTAGSLFGSTGRGHFRIACTVGIPALEQAFDRMERLAF